MTLVKPKRTWVKGHDDLPGSKLGGDLGTWAIDRKGPNDSYHSNAIEVHTSADDRDAILKFLKMPVAKARRGHKL